MVRGYQPKWILPFTGKSCVERQKITQDKATFLNSGGGHYFIAIILCN